MNRPRLAALGTLALALFLTSAASAQTASRVQCGAVRSTILKRAVKYCAVLPPSYDTEKTRRYPVLYYLHGMYENEQSMVNIGGWNLVEDLQRQGTIGEFLIVTPDGGRSFYINSMDGRERYEDFFIREFIPTIDKALRTKPARGSRGIAGVSMGGYGALRFAFKYPELFTGVSVHSAALVENPQRGFSAMLSPLLARLTRAFGSPPSNDYWTKQSPFTLLRQSPGLRGLRIYFDCGTEDDYGFYEGARQMHALLDSRRIAHEFHLYPGGHGWLYLSEHLHATMEFHSRLFGVTPAPKPKK